MAYNETLREDNEQSGSQPNEVYDYDYFRTKYGIRTEEVIQAIKDAKPQIRQNLMITWQPNISYRMIIRW